MIFRLHKKLTLSRSSRGSSAKTLGVLGASDTGEDNAVAAPSGQPMGSADIVATPPGIPVVESCENCRELGGYPTSGGGTTLPDRFLRSGSTSGVTAADLAYLSSLGLARVVDLRSSEEVHSLPDPLHNQAAIRYKNVPLHNKNLHDPRFAQVNSGDETHDFLANGYLKMLGNHGAVREIFRFFSHAKENECVLFHCAAGMDRTGIVSMLVLGLADVDRAHICADYGYSFGPKAMVDEIALGVCPAEDDKSMSPNDQTEDTAEKSSPHNTDPWSCGEKDSVSMLCDLMGTVFDEVVGAYGSVYDYLRACGCTERELGRVRRHLLGTE